MLNITNIEDALYTWVTDVAALATIFAHQNSPRPTDPYVLINILQSTPLGREESEATLQIDDSIDVDYSNVEELFVSINTYYSGAFQTATKLKDSLGRITVQETLFGSGLGYLRTGAVLDIPEEINENWEQRGQFDCFFSVRSLDEENIETIQKIEITNELDGTTTIIAKP